MRALQIACKASINVSGSRQHFKRAKFGLMREGSQIYIILVTVNYANPKLASVLKFPINPNTMRVVSEIIELKQEHKILCIREVSDKERYNRMIKEIKIIIDQNKYRERGKANNVDKLIMSIPTLDKFDLSPIQPDKVVIKRPGYSNQHSGDQYQPTVLLEILKDVLENSQLPEPELIIPKEYRENSSPEEQHFQTRYLELENRDARYITLQGLAEIPKSVWFRPVLLELTLDDCNLKEVPRQLVEFSHTLNTLTLSNNLIDKLPRSFCCRMSKLECLSLKNNNLETLPLEIKFLVNLQILDLSENRLKMLPTTFSDLRRLRSLHLANNNLCQLPALESDSALRDLNISDNPLNGAREGYNTYEVYPSIYDGWNTDYVENLFSNNTNNNNNNVNQRQQSKQPPKLFELSLLKIVRNDRLFKLASEERLPRTIVSTMQRDIFKCYKCRRMSILPAYNTTDQLDYLYKVNITFSSPFTHGMTFMKLWCRDCFDSMDS